MTPGRDTHIRHTVAHQWMAGEGRNRWGGVDLWGMERWNKYRHRNDARWRRMTLAMSVRNRCISLHAQCSCIANRMIEARTAHRGQLHTATHTPTYRCERNKLVRRASEKCNANHLPSFYLFLCFLSFLTYVLTIICMEDCMCVSLSMILSNNGSCASSR